jgi:hypothetical protein
VQEGRANRAPAEATLYLSPPPSPFPRALTSILHRRWAITAIVPPQFHTDDCTPNVNCPSITIYSSSTGLYTQVDTDMYLETVYGLKYSERWQAIGILIAYTGLFQILHFLATRYVSHINR